MMMHYHDNYHREKTNRTLTVCVVMATTTLMTMHLAAQVNCRDYNKRLDVVVRVPSASNFP